MAHIREKQLKDGSTTYTLVVENGKNADGNRAQRSKTLRGVTRKQAEQALWEFEQEVRDGNFIPRNNITLKEFLEQWIEIFIEPYNSPTTVAGYRHKCETYICAPNGGIGHYEIQKLNLMIIQKFINNISKASPATGKPLSAKTVRDTYLNLRACLEKAVDMEIINRNPARKVQLPKRQKHEVQVFTAEEIKTLLSALKREGSDLELPVNMALSMGMRRGEILGMKFSDVDYAEGTLHIHNNRVECCDYEVFEKEPKTPNSIRTINVPRTVLKMIKTQEIRWKEYQLKYGKDYNQEGYICFKVDTGKPWMPDNLSAKYRKFIRRLGLSKVSFHGLRHCYASLCLNQGVEILEISKKLGHASVSFTYDTYTHLMEDRGSYIANIMDEALYGEKAV